MEIETLLIILFIGYIVLRYMVFPIPFNGKFKAIVHYLIELIFLIIIILTIGTLFINA